MLFNDIINIKNLDLKNIKIYEKLYKTILIYHIGYMISNSVKFLHISIGNINGHFEESNGNEYLTIVPTYKSIYALKKYGEMWSKIKDLIRSINSDSDDYNKKYVKVWFISNDDDDNGDDDNDDDLPQTKTIELQT